MEICDEWEGGREGGGECCDRHLLSGPGGREGREKGGKGREGRTERGGRIDAALSLYHITY